MPWLAATIYWNGVFPSGWTKDGTLVDDAGKWNNKMNVCTDMTPDW